MAKKKLNSRQTKKLLPLVKQFNAAAKILIRVLNQKIEQKEKRLHTVSLMVTDIAPPQQHHNIMIQTVDINKTVIKKKGQLSYNQQMSWEDEIRKKRRGLIL